MEIYIGNNKYDDIFLSGLSLNNFCVNNIKSWSYFYTVHYKDIYGNKIHEDKIVVDKNLQLGSIVTEYAIDIEDYSVTDQNTKKINIGFDQNEITFTYTVDKRYSSYIIKYVDGDNVVYQTDPIVAVVGETIEVESTAPQYYYITGETKKTITIQESDNIVTFTCARKKAFLTIHYYKSGTSTSIKQDEIVNNLDVGKYYYKDSPSIENYQPKEDRQSIFINENNNVMIFYYDKTHSTLTIHHYKKDTTESVYDDEIMSLEIGTVYEAVSKTEKSNFQVSGSSKKSITIGEEDTSVTFYYNELGTIIIRYLDNDTKNSIQTQEEKKGIINSILEIAPKSINKYTPVNSEIQKLPFKSGSYSYDFYYNKIMITVSVPTISDIKYDGTQHKPVLTQFDQTCMKIIDGDNYQTNAGNYTVKIGLTDDFYQWDSNGDRSNKTLSWQIFKEFDVPTSNEISYDGNTHKPSDNGVLDGFDATYMSITNDTGQTVVQDYSVTITLKQNYYRWKNKDKSIRSVDVTWKIVPKIINVYIHGTGWDYCCVKINGEQIPPKSDSGVKVNENRTIEISGKDTDVSLIRFIASALMGSGIITIDDIKCETDNFYGYNWSFPKNISNIDISLSVSGTFYTAIIDVTTS